MDLLKSHILIVDDEPANVRLLQKLLGQHGFVNVRGTVSALEAVAIYRESRPDLVLLDLRMPELNGLEVMAQLQQMEADSYAPVLVMTAESDQATRRKVLQAGAKDFVSKPFDSHEVLSRIKNQLEVRWLYKRLEAHKLTLEDTVRARTRELSETRLEVVRRLGRAAEYRDNETGLHIMRMSKMSAALARQQGWSAQQCELMLNASPMHDIGKIGVPDGILLKPGTLDAREWDTMRLHPVIGAEILSGHDSELMAMAHDIALGHHEKWDGSGYPQGLAGEAIPLAARIVAVADVFDALTSARPYKPAWPIPAALTEMARIAGSHLDPVLVARFNEILPEVLEIKRQYAEPEGISRLHRMGPLGDTPDMRGSEPALNAQGLDCSVNQQTCVQQLQAHFAAMVASSTDAIIGKTLDGIVTSWNPAAQAMFGYSAEEMLGQPLLVLIPPDQADEAPAILAKIRQGEAVAHFETRRRRKHGEVFPVSVNISPIRDDAGRVIGASKIVRDISKRMEDGVRVSTLATYANHAKTRFLASVSHEFRTPLHAVLGFSQLVRDDPRLPEDVKDNLHEIETAGRSLLKLVDHILKMTDLEQG